MAHHRRRRRWPLAGRFRAKVLMLAGVEAVAFGYGIVQAIQAGNTAAPWLPQANKHIASVPDVGWAAVWIAAGALLICLGWWRPADRYLFTLTVFLHAAWSIAWVNHWLQFGGSGDWAPATSFGVAAAVLLLISGWPDP